MLTRQSLKFVFLSHLLGVEEWSDILDDQNSDEVENLKNDINYVLNKLDSLMHDFKMEYGKV